MHRRIAFLTAIFCCFLPAGLSADEKAIKAQIDKVASDVSEARIKAIIEKLVSFETRNTLSDPNDPVRGVGAAREWILKEIQSYSPKLQVHFDKYRVKKQGQRIFKDVDLYNVVALTAYNNIDLLYKQCVEPHPEYVVLVDENQALAGTCCHKQRGSHSSNLHHLE